MNEFIAEPWIAFRVEQRAQPVDEDIDAAMEIGNVTQVHRLAHSLKGSAGNIGARAMFNACRALDDAARDGKSDQLEKLVAAVRAEFARVKAEIQRRRA